MGARRIEIAPELVAEGKRLYEQTLTPIADIAAMMGVCRETLNNRSCEWGWKHRAWQRHHRSRAHCARCHVSGCDRGADVARWRAES
jgi:hypothetical protein